jgi:hypothetical protein
MMTYTERSPEHSTTKKAAIAAGKHIQHYKGWHTFPNCRDLYHFP